MSASSPVENKFEVQSPRRFEIPVFLKQKQNLATVLGVVVLITAVGLLGYESIKKQLSTPTQQEPVNANEGVDYIDSFKPVRAEHVFFYTKAIIPEKRRTYVQIPYYLESGEHREMWLSLQMTPDADGIVVIVDHPIFGEINWPRLDSPSASLYQKNPTYTSVEEFWNNPPTTGKILADPILAFSEQFSSMQNVTSLSDDLEWENYDYLLTTYRVPIEQDGYKIFETTVDTTKAELTDKQELFWKLDIPGNASENKVYIGEIHVDFRLPS